MVLVDTQLIATANIGGEGGVAPLPKVSAIVEEHKKVLDAIIEKPEECISVNELVTLTELKEDVVKEHLKILELNKFGMYSSDDGEFCSYDVLLKMKERIKKYDSFWFFCARWAQKEIVNLRGNSWQFIKIMKKYLKN